MCTAITYLGEDFYFGRNLDLERNYDERIIITPRKYPFKFRNGQKLTDHLAIIGMAVEANQYPLYFDAVNEKGLAMAGLNFPENAVYNDKSDTKINIASFELIPWTLSQCETTAQAKKRLENINIWNESFSSQVPHSPLHWIIADKEACITIESTSKGLTIYDNPVGILTNNPCFDYHMQNLSNYINITAAYPQNRFSNKYELRPYSLGMGALGLPGDPSSASRFIRAAFTKLNSIRSNDEKTCISEFFHILGAVEQVIGVTELQDGQLEYTMYSSCCNTAKGIYYYRTYYNNRINAVNIYNENLNDNKLVQYPLSKIQDTNWIN